MAVGTMRLRHVLAAEAWETLATRAERGEALRKFDGSA
jgi:hypothetical protein